MAAAGEVIGWVTVTSFDDVWACSRKSILVIELPGAVVLDVVTSVEAGLALPLRLSRCYGVCDSVVVFDGCAAVIGRGDGSWATDLSLSVVIMSLSDLVSPNDSAGSLLNGEEVRS